MKPSLAVMVFNSGHKIFTSFFSFHFDHVRNFHRWNFKSLVLGIWSKPILFISRAATRGKTSKTAVLPGICKIEHGDGSNASLWYDCHCGGLACQKSTMAALISIWYWLINPFLMQSVLYTTKNVLTKQTIRRHQETISVYRGSVHINKYLICVNKLIMK